MRNSLHFQFLIIIIAFSDKIVRYLFLCFLYFCIFIWLHTINNLSIYLPYSYSPSSLKQHCTGFIHVRKYRNSRMAHLSLLQLGFRSLTPLFQPFNRRLYNYFYIFRCSPLALCWPLPTLVCQVTMLRCPPRASSVTMPQYTTPQRHITLQSMWPMLPQLSTLPPSSMLPQSPQPMDTLNT